MPASAAAANNAAAKREGLPRKRRMEPSRVRLSKGQPTLVIFERLHLEPELVVIDAVIAALVKDQRRRGAAP